MLTIVNIVLLQEASSLFKHF